MKRQKLHISSSILVLHMVLALSVVLLSCSPPLAKTKAPQRHASVNDQDYEPVVEGKSSEKRNSVVKTAMSYIGTPYKRGGSDPRGFDCSGLSMYVFKKHKILLDRTAHAQYAHGIKVKNKSIKPGDLLFFTTAGKSITHVGIYIGKGRFVHAPSSGKHVEVEEISSIYWKPRFRGAATYFR
jgi:cell wall-associated NlpC family hydrolase